MRFLAATLAFLFLLTPAWSAPKFPALTGRVVDDANILSSATKADLDGKLAGLEQKTSRQLVVVTVSSLQGYEISDYGYQLGRSWGIGQKGLNNGILFIVAPKEHKTRIEVGYGLEPIVTDAFSSVVIQTQVLPKFRGGDFNGGVQAGADALIQQLSLETSEAERRAAVAAQQLRDQGHDSGGGGYCPSSSWAGRVAEAAMAAAGPAAGAAGQAVADLAVAVAALAAAGLRGVGRSVRDSGSDQRKKDAE
jgi:uncharacterized protein